MKIYYRNKSIKASSQNTLIQYHGGKIPTSGFIKDSGKITLPDLGLHVGSIEQARSHSKTNIYAVKFNLVNVVEVEDQNDWNTVEAVYAILSAAGSDISFEELTSMVREFDDSRNGDVTWKSRSGFFTKLLTENGVSVIKYYNTIDTVKGTCYCIVDPSVIVNIEEVEFDLDRESQGFQQNSRYADVLDNLPEWAHNNIINAYYSMGPGGKLIYVVDMRPIEGDPDHHIIRFSGYLKEIIQQLSKYSKTFETERRLTTEQAMRHPHRDY